MGAPYLFSFQSPEWLNRFESEQDNIRVAIKWALSCDPRMAARILAATRHLAGLRLHTSETRYWLEEVLKRSDELPPDLCCEMLTGLGVMCQYNLDYAAERVAHE